LALLAITALAGSNAVAQGHWTPEIGVRGGFVRSKPAGTSAADHTDAIDVPGVGYGSIFAVIPFWHRLALEPNVGFSQLAIGVPPGVLFLSGTNVNLGLRTNFAITAHLFTAIGGQLLYSEAAGQHDAQIGVQAALGYRTALSRRLVARVEAQVIASARGYRNALQPANTYSALLGISARADHPAAAPTGTGTGLWVTELGVAAGYTRAHLSGPGLTADITLFASPGSSAAAGVPAPPTVFFVIPVWRRWALEPGFDVHRTRENGTTSFTGTFSARVNYAVAPHWYAALGPVVQVVNDSTNSTLGVSGVGAAWGARFRLAGDVGGRVELAYATFKERSGSPFTTNTLAVSFAATLPLK
jgi:hypothetical protein